MLTYSQLLYLRRMYGRDVADRIFDSVLEFFSTCGDNPIRYFSAYNFLNL